MGKIKIALTNGNVEEKPLINAFSINESSYVVLDNEMTGSMGLPIILISKLVDNKLNKIDDQNEWQNVKDQLKNIIAGHKLQFINVAPELAGDEVFYNQLTLPVASFDALKANYIVENTETVAPVQEAVQVEPMPVSDAPVSPEVTPVPEVSAPSPVIPETPVAPEAIEEPIVDAPDMTAIQNEVNQIAPVVPDAPAIDIDVPPVEQPAQEETVSIMDTNIPEVNIEAPVNNEIPSVGVPTVEPIITPTPVIDAEIPAPPVEENPFKEQKEAFMQACENMFDALVQKFEKELNNK